MKRATIFDGNNVFQRWTMHDVTGRPVRNLLDQITTAPHQPVVVWDGRGALRARREIYPDYKMQRESKGEDLYAAMELLQTALTHTNAVQFKVPGYEADDVIATLVRREAFDVQHIHTNDEDLAALGVPTDKEPKVEPQWLPTYKASVGDKSDNIPGIRGFGPAAWTDVENHGVRHDLERLLSGQIDRSDELLNAVTKTVANKLSDPEVIEQARIYRRVVEFFDVPLEDVLRNMMASEPDRNKVESVLTEYEV